MEYLADALEGNAIHSTVQDELRTLASDLRDVLKGYVKAHVKEL